MSIGTSGLAVMTIACVLTSASVGFAQTPPPVAPAPAGPTAPDAVPAVPPRTPDATDTTVTKDTPPTAATSAPAATAEAPAQPSPEALERAREAYAQGQRAFAQGDYPVAQAAFEEAFANVPNPIVLVSIAQSAAKQGRVEAALAAYDKYLQLRPDAPDRADIEQARTTLAQTPAELTITSEPPGADVMVDGAATAKRTPALLQLSPGTHRIELVLAGYASEPVEATVAPGAHTEQAVSLRPEAPSPPPVPTEAVPAAAVSAKPPVAAIVVTSSLGAAGLIVGTTLGILALGERSDYNRQPTSTRADNGERLALFADVGFGIGAMALITTAVLLLTHDSPAADQAPQTARLQIVPNVTTRGASASAQLRF